jgi:hypothetical protein
VLFSAVIALKELPDEAHAEYSLLQAFLPDLLPSIILFSWKASTPDPLISPPVGGTSLCSSLYGEVEEEVFSIIINA